MKLPHALLGAALVVAIGALHSTAQAQTAAAEADVSRYEIGVHAHSLGGHRLSDVNDGGFGGRFTYNLTKHLALDTELNVPVDFDDDYFVVNGVQGFAGLKAGGRYKRVGLFAKARPGFVTNFHRVPPGGQPFAGSERVVKPAFDVGGVVELYLSKHTGLRYDAGVLIIPFGGDQIYEVRCPCPRRLGTTYNFASSLGFTVRF
jgi:hypothetical protein